MLRLNDIELELLGRIPFQHEPPLGVCGPELMEPVIDRLLELGLVDEIPAQVPGWDWRIVKNARGAREHELQRLARLAEV